MIPRLLFDLVRRKRFVLLFAPFQVYILGRFLLDQWSSADPMAVAMAAAAALTLPSGSLFQSRELYQLPISRQTFWRASWWLGSVGTSAFATLAVAAAHWQARSQVPAPDEIAMIFMASALYCALILSVPGYSRAVDQPATSGSLLLTFALMGGIVSAPFFIAPSLPHSTGALSIMWIAGLVTLAAVAARGYWHQPPIEARLHQRAQRSERPTPATHPDSCTKPVTQSFADRLTGWRLVLRDECRKYLIVFTTVVVLAVTTWAAIAIVRPVPSLTEFLRQAGGFPFSDRLPRVTEPIMMGVWLFIIGATDSWLTSGLRTLRTLPISTTRLACLPLGMSLISTSMLWIVLLAIHLVALDTWPVSLRFDLFVALAALTAVSLTSKFAAPGAAPVRTMLGIVPIMAIWLALGYFEAWRPETVRLAMLIGGPLGLAVAFAVMRFAVARRGGIYRRRTSGM